MKVNKKESEKIINEYWDRKNKSYDRHYEFYNKIKNARKAFKQILPDDITYSASNDGRKEGNTGNTDESPTLRNTSSTIMSPLYTATADRIKEELSAMPYRYEFAGNNRAGDRVRRYAERKLRHTFTKNKIASKESLLKFHFVVSGIGVSQTIYTNKRRRLTNGKTIQEGSGIDMIVYDPLTTFFDWNANVCNMRETSDFIIVTTGFFSADYIESKWGIAVGGGNSIPDSHKIDLMRDRGDDESNSVPVREYYTADGYYYTIVGDSHVVEKNEVSNGDADRIPINIAPTFVTADSNKGYTLWEKVKWPVAMMSLAINQVADNNAMNNNMPFVVPEGANLSFLSDENMSGLKVMEITPLDRKTGNIDIRRYITRPEIREVTEGAQFMYEVGQESLYFNTGTSPMSFGVQDKQIRNTATAQMISNSLVRSESEMAKNIEIGYVNPTSWDVLQIFAMHAKDFDFDEEIANTLLDNLESIRVVNGSYLPGDRMTRLAKLEAILNKAYADPGRYELEDLLYDYLDAIGVADPYKYIKDGLQMTKERLSQLAIQQIGEEGMNNKIKMIIAKLAELVDQQEAMNEKR